MKKWKSIGLIMVVIGLNLLNAELFAQDFEKGSPFSGLRWEEEAAVVKIEAEWYELVAINTVTAEDIIDFCKSHYGEKARKRFGEDLIMVMAEMKRPLDKTTSIRVWDRQTNKVGTFPAVPVTRANRELIRRAVRAAEEAPPARLNPKALNEDLNQFKEQLEQRFAYLLTNRIDYHTAIEAIRQKGSNGIRTQDLRLEIQQVLALFIDGHAGVRKLNFKADGLPFYLHPVAERVVAVKGDRSGFLEAGYPFLVKINGLDINHWIAMADEYVAQGSAQLRLFDGTRRLRQGFTHFREKLGLPVSDTIEVELLSSDQLKVKKRSIVLTNISRSAPQSAMPSHIMENNIGYLRIPSFSGDGPAEQDIETWMPKFRNTRGLVIDVRGNGGGSRIGLLRLVPYLMDKHNKPSVANVCAYRLNEAFDPDHLEIRFAYREDSEHWTDRERETIAHFKRDFTPQWAPPQGGFSDWHYLLLSKKDSSTKYHYNKPIIVLHDAACFSATDIFLGALKNWRPNIKLMGSPSSGGSARSVTSQLRHSKIYYRSGSMVSFQRNGMLYDTNGISPDYLVYPDPEYFIGGEDTVLEKAIKVLLQE